MHEVAQILRTKGLKVTPQRIAIYTMLMDTKKHPNAETIYKTLESTNPTMSLATVYKTLDSFKNSGLVQELNVGEGCARYDGNVSPHPHVVCTCCAKVFDLEMEGFNHLRDKVAALTEFEIDTEQFIFYGKCPECKNKVSNQNIV